MKFEINSAARLRETVTAAAALDLELKKAVNALTKTTAPHHAGPSVNKATVVRQFYPGDEETYEVNSLHGELSFVATFMYQEDIVVEFVAIGKTAPELIKNTKKEAPKFVKKHTDSEDSDEPVSFDSLEELQSVATQLKLT